PAQVHFSEGWVWEEGQEVNKVPLKDLIALAYRERINLSARGFYRTPDIHFDKEAGRGHPFHYFAFGMAVSEVEVDLLRGVHKVLRVDILHDAGASLHPAIDLGQVRGAFVQGMGWVTLEEVVWDAQGRLLTDSPDTYKIPTFCDIPKDFRVKLLEDAPNPLAVKQSKAVGEPPFMLALSVWLAIKDALSAVDDHEKEPPFRLPATYEVILRTCVALQKSC
ncbi:MAG TPA: molybdopterin-dependent oxidoreductase, partial [Bacteroidales bacterium]|nr:molybdopterin-dependent oxidoreductase [Bacteroidales bacterium]